MTMMEQQQGPNLRSQDVRFRRLGGDQPYRDDPVSAGSSMCCCRRHPPCFEGMDGWKDASRLVRSAGPYPATCCRDEEEICPGRTLSCAYLPEKHQLTDSSILKST